MLELQLSFRKLKKLNIGILAHIDAGKTSTTERILFEAGALKNLGSVDTGTTSTDSLEQEKQRGITIQSAVTAFKVGDVHVNLVDTPGHPDFIAEIERTLDVLDAAVLVVSAVEGVQAQTRVLFRALKRRGIPFLIFVNKIDRMGARCFDLIDEIRARLTSNAVPLGTVSELGKPEADYVQFEISSRDFVWVLADYDEEILSQSVEFEGQVDPDVLNASLKHQVRSGNIHPVVFGSAITGAGTENLIKTIAELLSVETSERKADPRGTVFKIERTARGEKVCYVRMFEGELSTRERVNVGGKEQRINAIQVFNQGRTESQESMSSGDIAKVWGLSEARIGSWLGKEEYQDRKNYFAPPLLETSIRSIDLKERGKLFNALAQLAEQDPLINLRQDDNAGLLFISLYGEVQKEVIEETLRSEFNVKVEFGDSSIIYIERVVGTGLAYDEAPNPFIATIGLRIEPRPEGAGNEFALEINPGTVPGSFLRAVEEAAEVTLQQGLYGWQVTDCKVTVTESIRHRDWATSTAADHRKLAPLTVMDALKTAGTAVCEPIQQFYLECPSDCVGGVIAEIVLLRALPAEPVEKGAISVVEGTVPAAKVQEVQKLMPGLTRGEGFIETNFSHYAPVVGEPPTRPRTDKNPLNRADYLRQVS